MQKVSAGHQVDECSVMIVNYKVWLLTKYLFVYQKSSQLMVCICVRVFYICVHYIVLLIIIYQRFRHTIF